MLTALPPIYFPTSHHTPPSTTDRRAWRFPRDTLVYGILDVLLVSYSHSPTPKSLQHRAADLASLWIALGVRRSLDTYCTVQLARLCVAAKAYVLSDAAPRVAQAIPTRCDCRMSHRLTVSLLAALLHVSWLLPLQTARA
jgi:hypothetical protein